ncbi:MAG: recombinase family protein [Bacteriovoracaceae bacterium]|nr:recombinase family protein [Bacteriovoracaceae bacterium]
MFQNDDWRGSSSDSIAILRRSSRGQQYNTSETSQDEDTDEYVKKLKLNLVKVFPIIESAKDSENRKKFHEAMAWADKHKIRHRIFYKADRETRNLTDNEQGEKDIRADKYVLHYVQERKVLHKNSPDSDFLMRDYQAVQNKHYSRDLTTKIGRSLIQKAESGWFPGQCPPWGYINQHLKNEKGFERRRGTIIVIDPSWKTAVVKREFELRCPPDLSEPQNCRSYLEIRKIIVDEGLIPTDQIKSYHTGSIQRRLQYKFYDCRYDWQGVEHEGKHERFISKELFWAVQTTFGLKNPYQSKDGIFSEGWLTCANPSCGCFMTYDPKDKIDRETKQVKKTHYYYHCANGKSIHEKQVNITEGSIWEQFGAALDQLSLPEEFAKEVAAELNAGHVTLKETMKREAIRVEETIAALEKEHYTLYQDYRKGIIKHDFFTAQQEEIEKQIASLKSRPALNLDNATLAKMEETVRSTFELAINAKLLWSSRTPQEKKDLLEMLLSNRRVNGKSVEYDWKKPFQILLQMKQDQEWLKQ